MNTFLDFINESVVDIPKNSLDSNVFDFFDDRLPVLKAGIKYQIAKDVDNIEEYVRIRRFYIVGSILSRNYTKDSDIDVTVEVSEKDVNDITEARVLKYIKHLNGSLATGTTHPINYYVYITDDDLDPYRFDAIYDIINDKWVKQPKNLEVNVEKYLRNFENVVRRADLVTAKLRRDIIDFKELSTFNNEEIENLKQKLQSKIYDINRDVDILIDFKKTIRKNRDDGYSRPLTPEEIEKFKTRNHLPENVIYKLLEKYYYWDFIQRLEEILGNKKIIKINDIKAIEKTEKDFMSESYNPNKRDVIVFGFVDEDGYVQFKVGKRTDSHDNFNMTSSYGSSFRYLPKTETIYWWRAPNREMLASTVAKLKSYGYKIKTPYVDIKATPDTFDISHGYKDVEDRDLMPESFKQFILKEDNLDTKPVEKVTEKTKDSQIPSPSLKIRDRKDAKIIPEYKLTDPIRAVVTNFLKPYLAKPSFNPIKIGLIKLPTGQTVRIADMLVNAFPPTLPLTDEEPSKVLGNTQIVVYKIGDNYYMKKN